MNAGKSLTIGDLFGKLWRCATGARPAPVFLLTERRLASRQKNRRLLKRLGWGEEFHTHGGRYAYLAGTKHPISPLRGCQGENMSAA